MDPAQFAALDALIKELDQRTQEQAVKFRPSSYGEPLTPQSRESLEKKFGEQESKFQFAVQKEQALKRQPPPKEGVSDEIKQKFITMARRQQSDTQLLHHTQEQTAKTLARHQEQEAKLLARGNPIAQQGEAIWKRMEHNREQEFKLRERMDEQKLKALPQKELMMKAAEHSSKSQAPEAQAKVHAELTQKVQQHQGEERQKLAHQMELLHKAPQNTVEREQKTLRYHAEQEQKRLQQIAQERGNKEKMMREMIQKMTARRESPRLHSTG